MGSRWGAGVLLVCLVLLTGTSGRADIGREVQQEYRQEYVNKALFLRRPVRGEKDRLYLRGDLVVDDPASRTSPLTFKVGEQVRIMEIDFKDSSIEFELAAVDQSRRATLIFDFGESLTYTFHRRPAFESALDGTFSEGISYRELDSAKEKYVTDQYDRMVRQFSDTTGTSTEFVNKAILESRPEYAQLQKELEQARQRLSQTESSLAEERTARRNLELQVQEVRSGLSGANESVAALRDERDQLQRERNQLDQELSRIKSENAKFRDQVQAVASKLNVQVDSNSQLGRQVDSLSKNIDTLSQDKARLTGQVAELDRSITELTRDRERLGQELSDARRRVEKLQGDLRAVTSDRGSLESTYLSTKEAKEKLELADRLEEAVKVTRSIDESGETPVYRGEILLLSQPIGTLEVIPPASSETPAVLRLKTASPNTVQFTEEERRLYQSLGGALKLEASLKSSSAALQSDLVSGEAVQSAPPREAAEWRWNLTGTPRPEDMISLELRLVDENGQKIPLDGYHFKAQSAGLFTSLGGGYSWGSVLVGLLAGVALAGIGVAFRDRSTPRGNGDRTRSVSGEKQL